MEFFFRIKKREQQPTENYLTDKEEIARKHCFCALKYTDESRLDP